MGNYPCRLSCSHSALVQVRYLHTVPAATCVFPHVLEKIIFALGYLNINKKNLTHSGSLVVKAALSPSHLKYHVNLIKEIKQTLINT